MSPERAQGWLAFVLPLMAQGGPILTLFALLVGAGTVWYTLGVLERSVQRNHALVQQLQGCMKEQVELVLRLRERQP